MTFYQKHKKQEEGNVDAWLMTYADMITLLLCFFIIFVSISEPKEEKLAQITNGIKSRFGTVELATPFIGVFRSVQGIIETNEIFREAAVEKSEKGVTVELSVNTFFVKNSATINPQKQKILEDLAAAFKESEFKDFVINIESHSDDEQPDVKNYASSWDLTALQAAHLARFFVDQGIEPEHVRASGLADALPKVPNADRAGNVIPENREQNKRIVLKLERKLQ
jgi:chemotaxis protein MotB